MNRDVIAEIAAERRRQIEVEGWTPAHDDTHDNGEMAHAAACYVLGATGASRGISDLEHGIEATISARLWPWSMNWWKPKRTRQNLIRAAALIVAEIERLDREAPTEGSDDQLP